MELKLVMNTRIYLSNLYISSLTTTLSYFKLEFLISIKNEIQAKIDQF